MTPPYSSTGSGYRVRVDKWSYSKQAPNLRPFLHKLRALAIRLRALAVRWCRKLRWYWNKRGRALAFRALASTARQVRRDMAMRRVFSFPHLMVVIWMMVLLWGERWVFHAKVRSCRWSEWEKWPVGAEPHRLVLVADPQLVDPHTYIGRPWPLSDLTYKITDNYMIKSYKEIQGQLDPDTIFFLGDLFDGGREWMTAHGGFKDAEWAPHPESEQEYLRIWKKKYDQAYWEREYGRFVDLFVKPWIVAGQREGAEGRRRKLIASLPGNHDIGFGARVKIPVRNRFQTWFGDSNRVDVVGNHTFVSVDTLSLSAATSREASEHDLTDIFTPVQEFLEAVQEKKRTAVGTELRWQRGETAEPQASHRIEDVNEADFQRLPSAGERAPDLPTILLTHVPLYRPPGTPCGSRREHWRPAEPARGQKRPVMPDHRNAISVSQGYQYQNVLNEEDSIELIEKIGNVVQAFSGDDHDYCELTHSARQGRVPEITVKSINMAMGVPTPGFVMVSLYNPLSSDGRPRTAKGTPTLQTHLCLLPNQLSTFVRYAALGILSMVILTVYACLVPILGLPRFALDPEPRSRGVLPVFKAKVEDDDEYALQVAGSYSASRSLYGASTRDRSGSVGFKANGQAQHTPARETKSVRTGARKGASWAWGRARRPKIEIRGDSDLFNGWKWKEVTTRRRAWTNSTTGVVVREWWTAVWRIAWMVLLFYVWLTWRT